MITVELLYDAVGPKRTTTQLTLPDGAKVQDALIEARRKGFKIGYMQVWLNMEPLNDPVSDLLTAVPDKSVLQIRMVERWEI